jgi:hypothetical protein
MTDLYTLIAKIRTLPQRRIAEVDDFVDFLARRGTVRKAKPSPYLEQQMHDERMQAIENANRARYDRPPLSRT